MAPVASLGEEAAEAQQLRFAEEDVSQMNEKVRELAQQLMHTDKEELESWLGRLDSRLQEISDLQERGNLLQGALKELEGWVEDLRARSVEPAAEQVEALKVLRGASEVLRKRWPEEPPKEWKGVTFKEGQVSELSLEDCDDLESLPAEVGGMRALTSLDLHDCKSLTSPPKELHLDIVGAKDWLHGQHLVAQHTAKDWDSDEMLRRLCASDRPGVLHALAEQPTAANFLRAVFEADPALADATEGDKLGRTPIEHACPECGVAMRAALCLLGRFEIDDGPPLHLSAPSAVVQADEIGGADGHATSGTNAKPPRRALKAMRKAEQVLAELNGRDGLDSKY